MLVPFFAETSKYGSDNYLTFFLTSDTVISRNSKSVLLATSTMKVNYSVFLF